MNCYYADLYRRTSKVPFALLSKVFLCCAHVLKKLDFYGWEASEGLDQLADF